MRLIIQSLRILCKNNNVQHSSYLTLGKQLSTLGKPISLQKLNFHSSAIIKNNIHPRYVDILNAERQQLKIVLKNLEKEKRDKLWQIRKLSFTLFGCTVIIGGSLFIWFLTKPLYIWNDGTIVIDEYSHLPLHEMIWKRICRQLNYHKRWLLKLNNKKKLLPNPLKCDVHQSRFTLVLELDSLLVYPVWTYQNGWRFEKRPGVDEFLKEIKISQFEVVVYTAVRKEILFWIIKELDVNNCIKFGLAKETTIDIDGDHVKDLDNINRDLRKVIVVDWNLNSNKLHPRNVLLLPKWNGNDDDDKTLSDLTAFLKMIHETNVADVRDVLDHYHQFGNPLEAFKDIRSKLLQMEKEKTKQQQLQKSQTLVSRMKLTFTKTNWIKEISLK